jgi:transcriptional regulator with XRE-family HTH domain
MASGSESHLLSLGAFLRQRRRALSLTQTQLAERLGWAQERISLLEGGKYGMPSLPTLARLATGLGVDMFDILQAVGYADGTLTSVGQARTAAEPQTAAAMLFALERLLGIEADGLETALGQASDLVAQAIGAEQVDAYLHHPDEDCLVATASSTLPLGRRMQQIGLNKVPLENGGRLAEVFQTGASYLTGHAEQDPVILQQVREQLGARSLIIVPLVVGGTRRGILVAISTYPERFGEADLPFLEAVARWVGMVARQAELAQVAREKATQRARER